MPIDRPLKSSRSLQRLRYAVVVLLVSGAFGQLSGRAVAQSHWPLNQRRPTTASESMPLEPIPLDASVFDANPTAPESREALAPLQPIPFELPADDPGEVDLKQAPGRSQKLVRKLILDNLPEEFENTKRWGKQKRIWDGLDVRTRGFQIRTKRKWKEVNHGTWKRYQASPVDPEETMTVRVVNLHRIKPGHIGFDVLASARLVVSGRLQEWNRGVRLFSTSAEATADVTLFSRFELTTAINPLKLPPDVILKPKATAARVDVDSFDLVRISKADGPVVRQFGEALEEVVQRKVAEKNDQLVDKINQQIAKNQDDLRLSLSDFVKNKWLGIKPQASSKSPSAKIESESGSESRSEVSPRAAQKEESTT